MRTKEASQETQDYSFLDLDGSEHKMRTLRVGTDLYTVKEFHEEVTSGMFTDYDGFGYLATPTHESEIRIQPSYFGHLKLPMWVTHVTWYNK